MVDSKKGSYKKKTNKKNKNNDKKNRESKEKKVENQRISKHSEWFKNQLKNSLEEDKKRR